MLNEAKLFPSKILKTVTNNVNVSRPYPQLFYFPGVTSKPWHEAKEFPITKFLQDNFKEIRKEYMENKE